MNHTDLASHRHYLYMRHLLSQLNELEWDGEDIPQEMRDEWNRGMETIVHIPEVHGKLKERFLTDCPPWVVE